MSRDVEYSGVRSIPLLEEAVETEVYVEDFSWNVQKFKIEKYNTDIIFLRVLDWKHKDTVIEIDLWTKSLIEAPIKTISSVEWVTLFDENQKDPTWLAQSIANKDVLDINNIIEKRRQYYKDKIRWVAVHLSKCDAELIADSLIADGLFTRKEISHILGEHA